MSTPLTHAKMQKLKEKFEGKKPSEANVEVGQVSVAVTEDTPVKEKPKTVRKKKAVKKDTGGDA